MTDSSPSTTATPFKFRAFMSYAHRDGAAGEKLHKELEHYAMPVELAGKPGRHGLIPQKLRPIFRDRYDLEAGHSLGEQVREALRLSEALIVICSPNSAKSSYVDEEIRIFKSLGRADRIYAIIIAGEPGDPAQECFPKALRYKVDADGSLTSEPEEPIAADLRPEGDGEDLAKLKVIAGLIGVELDVLRQREAEEQRRQKRLWRRIAWGMGGLAVIAVVTSGIALFQFDAKQRALTRNELLLDKTLSRASNLVGIGTNVDQYGAPIKLGLALLAEAQGVFKDMDEIKVTSADLPLRRAEMLISFADSHGKVGKHVEQRQAATEALAIAEAAVQAKPSDLSRLDLVAQAWQRIGNAYSGQRELLTAIDAYNKAIDIRLTKLGGVETKKVEHLVGLSEGYRALSIAHNRRDERAGAKTALVKALGIADRLESLGADSMLVAERRVTAYQALADIERSLGNRPVAQEVIEKALTVTTSIREARPDDLGWLRREASLLLVDGDVKRDLKRPGEALKSFRRCSNLRQRLHLADPGHTSIAAEYAYSLVKVGEIEANQKRLDAAEEAFKASRAIYESQIKANPENFSAVRQLMDALDGLGDVAERRSRFEEMAEIYRYKVTVAERILSKDRENRDSMRLVARARLSLGEAHSALGRYGEAVPDFRISVAIRRKVYGATNLDSDQRSLAKDIEELSQALVEVDQLDEAAPLYDEALAIRQKFASAPNSDTRSKVTLTAVQEQFAGLSLKRGDRQRALSLLTEVVTARRAHAHDTDNEVTRRDLAGAMEKLALVHLALGEAQASVTASESALQIRAAQAEADPENIQKRALVAATLATAGKARLELRQCEPAGRDLKKSHELFAAAAAAVPINLDWPARRDEVAQTIAAAKPLCEPPPR